MNKLFFWNEWQKSYQILYTILLLIFFSTVFWFVWEYQTGVRTSFPIDTKTEVKSIVSTWHKFNKGIFELSIEGENLVLEEKYDAQNFQFNSYAAYIYFVVWLLVGIILITLSSTLGILWYASCMTLFVFFASHIKLDFIGFLGNNPIISPFVIMILMYLPLSYYFQINRQNTQFFKRLLAFGIITLLLFVWVSQNYRVALPIPLLVAHGATIPLIISLVFITIIAHEIPLALFSLISQYNTQGNGRQNIIHFTVITLIYLGNLTILYLKQNEYLTLDIFYFDTFWFYIIAVVLGIWGYKKRAVLIENIMPFAPQGALFYLSGAILTTSTLAYHFSIANDPMIDVLNDTILFTFIGFGVGFYVYVVINFAQLLKLDYQISEIIYEGKVFPYWIVRYFGFGLAFILYLSINQYTYYQSKAGYYNVVADAYWLNNDFSIAQKYYEIAKNNDYYNHRSNYLLSIAAERNKDYKNMVLYLLEATKRQPTEQTFLKISNLYASQDLSFEATFNLQKAVQIFPKSVALCNNLGLLYVKNKVLDSAIIYFEKAQKIDKKSIIPQNNLWALLAKNPVKNTKLADILKQPPETDNLISQVNQIALHNAYKTDYQVNKIENILPKIKDDIVGLAFTHNYLLNKLGKKDKNATLIAKQFKKIDKNREFAYNFNFIKANYDYFQGNTQEAIKTLAAMPVLNSEPYYNTIMAFWLMEQKADVLAISYLDKALELGNENAQFYRAIALTEIGDLPLAQQAWAMLTNYKNQDIKQFAQRILPILTQEKEPATDTEKYNFVRYQKNKVNTEKLLKVAESMQDINYKNWALAQIIHFLLDKNQVEEAENIYKKLSLTPNSQSFIKSEINLAYSRILAGKQQYDELLKEIDSLVFTFPHQYQKYYLKALAFEFKKDFIEAEKFYLQAVQATPYLEQTILSVAQFYKINKKDDDKAYHFLVEGVRLNPFSIPILKQYALQALAIGLDYYGDDAMNKLQELTDKQDFDKAVEQYEQAKKQLVEKRLSIKN